MIAESNLISSSQVSYFVSFYIDLFVFFGPSQVVDDQCAVFNSIEQLKDRPTHLLVFMQHVFLQFDPAPMVRTTARIMQAALQPARCRTRK